MKKTIAAAIAVALLAACGGDDEAADTTTAGTEAPDTTTAGTDGPPVTDSMPAPDTTDAGAEGVLNVPDDFATIQAAVDAAAPGDLILIAPGTYNEAVNVVTDELTIRGLDRNEVVLDGQFELDNGIRVLGAKGVTVENMTATNYTANGFFWTGSDGYRGSYLTAYRTGDYGVYAFDSINGQLDHIYAAGSPDAGVYIGNCYPCNTVITDVVSEHNGLGYSGTNSGGDLYIVNSVFRFNRAGVVPNSGSYELCYPERDTTIIGNLIYSNNQPDTPAIDVALLAMGNGIVVAGGIRNTIERNQIWDHDKAGIALVPFLEEDPNDELPTVEEWELTCDEAKQIRPVDPEGAILWESYENRVVGNELSEHRQFDIINATASVDVSTTGNCFAGNVFGSAAATAPAGLETLAPCDADGTGDWAAAGTYDIFAWLAEEKPPSVDWKTAELPDLEPQDNMPDAATAPASPAVGLPAPIDVDAITVPAKTA